MHFDSIKRLALILQPSTKKANSGFSLAEAVATLALGMTLTAIAIPSYNSLRTTFGNQAKAVGDANAAVATDVATELGNTSQTAAQYKP